MSLYKKIAFNDGVDYSVTDISISTDRWIIAQRGDISLSVTTALLEVSLDNSNTFPNSLAYADADLIQSAHIFNNGNILIQQSDNKLFLTDFELTSITEKIVYESDGVTAYTLHTPSNANFPGAYFYTHRLMSDNGENVYCWGNYGNVAQGATPTNIYYTTDFGNTIKIAYEFGQNLRFRDDGSFNGGTSGTLLGDSGNSIVTRHTHSLEYNPYNDKWYCCTGDRNVTSPIADEIHWLEGTYTESTDTWSWVLLNFGASIEETSRLKGIEMFFHNDSIFWGADATNTPNPNPEKGIWMSPMDTFTDSSTHTQLIDFPNWNDFCSNVKLDETSGNILFMIGNTVETADENAVIGVAKNYGYGAVDYKSYYIWGYNFVRLQSPNNEGYFRLCTAKRTTLQETSFLIKVGEDLFDNL